MKALKILNQYNSFKALNQQLEQYTKNQQTKLAGDIFELAVKLYLQTNPKYRTKLKNVWLLKEVKENIKQKLNLPNEDEGIDLIAETYDKRYWAIQAKYRSDPRETLTLGGSGGLATFNSLAFNYCKNISHGLICTTVDKPPKKIRLLKSVGFETLESWLALDDNNQEGWKHLVAKSKGKIIKPKPFKPRPHQVKAIQKSLSYFKKNDRGKIIMPCASGKSLAAFWITRRMNAKKILIAVPSLALLQQTLKVWTREFLIHKIQPDWLCVCSDESVKEDQDDFVSYTYDLGIEVTTDKGQIKKFLKTKSKNIKVIFTTYQSGKVTAQGSKGFTYDLGIMDEAHKTVGHSKKPMAHLIHQKNIKVKNRLFMTATERLFRGDEDEYLSMDDPRDYGNIIYQLSFKEAINSKPPIISDYKVITFGISEPEIEEVYKSNKYIQVKKEIKNITAREFATAIALRKAIKKLKITNAISFHRSILRAKNFRQQQELITKVYPDYQPIKTFHVSGEMPTNQRSSQMRLFAESKGLMTNARCLTEGVDLPAIDCVCFTDPKRSRVDIVQAAGRALRLSKGKKFGYILIPIFVSKNQDPNEAAEDSGFEEVIATVGALSTQDTRIADYLRAVTEGEIPRGGNPIDGITKVNVLTKVDSDIFEKSIKLKIWDKIARTNFRPYEDAKKYLKKFNIKSAAHFTEIYKQRVFAPDIPYSGPKVYKNSGWESWGDYIGSGVIDRKLKKFIDFYKLKIRLKKLKINSAKKYDKYRQKNRMDDWPATPGDIYKKYMKSYSDLFDDPRNVKIVSFKKAKKIIKKFNLKSVTEFNKKYKTYKLRWKGIPIACRKVYGNQGWKGWSDFLQHGNVSRRRYDYLKYNEAKKILKKYNIRTKSIYRKIVKKNKLYLPIDPYSILKNRGWKGWKDYLGKSYDPHLLKRYNKAKHLRNALSHNQTKHFIKKYKFPSIAAYHRGWKKFNLEKKHIPMNANKFYKNKGWKGWNDFLGTG